MKTLRQLVSVLGALSCAAGFAADPKASPTSKGNGLPPDDPTSIVIPTDPSQQKDYFLSVESTAHRTRAHGHKVYWETYTPLKNNKRLPALFKCKVENKGGGQTFSLYETGAQGKQHAVIIRFEDPTKVRGMTGVPAGTDLSKPILIEPMLYWDESSQRGSKPYSVTFTGKECVFYAVYADFTDLTDIDSKARQPGDGAPPPAGSGQAH